MHFLPSSKKESSGRFAQRGNTDYTLNTASGAAS